MVKEFHRRRDLILKLLGEIEGFKLNVPKGAFYIFPDISSFFGKTIKGIKIDNASEFALFILEHANVATVAGEAFGASDCIRISYAASEENIRTAISRIKEALR
jgi:aspartate aminotransferase